MKHARYYWLLLAEGHLTRRVFAAILRRIWTLPISGVRIWRLAGGERVAKERTGNGKCPGLRRNAFHGAARTFLRSVGKKVGRAQGDRCILFESGRPKWKFRVIIIGSRRLHLCENRVIRRRCQKCRAECSIWLGFSRYAFRATRGPGLSPKRKCCNFEWPPENGLTTVNAVISSG